MAQSVFLVFVIVFNIFIWHKILSDSPKRKTKKTTYAERKIDALCLNLGLTDYDDYPFLGHGLFWLHKNPKANLKQQASMNSALYRHLGISYDEEKKTFVKLPTNKVKKQSWTSKI